MIRSRNLSLFATALLASVLLGESVTAEPLVEFNKGDHVAYIGSGLPDRMQHAGYLETYIHALHPNHDLMFRNLGFPGDELVTRSRSNNFGSPKDWLTKCEADVIFCFFGFNEAFSGDDGLDGFRKDLKSQIDEMRSTQYNGESAPRLVFFSPIKHEDTGNPNLSDGSANNKNLVKYTAAMREVCAAEDVPFVDLYAISEKSYDNKPQPLTINGVHLTEDGNGVIARGAVLSLFGKQPTTDKDELERLRAAVLDKNFIWYSRYRVVDGFNVYGGRSKLAWHGQSNADVMSREMQIYDVMAENRDKRVWAVAKGSDLDVKDDNLPAELPVKTNKPGKLEGESHPYFGGEEAIEKMTVAKGMEVNLFASEERFPELVNPVQMTVDPDGDLYVATWPSYPHWNPTQPMSDRICFLPDRNRDGVADDCITFADKLNSVTAIHFWGGGLIVAMAPELWFFKDTDGDGIADLRKRIFQGITSADTHHSANSMVLGPHGNLHFSRGIFNTAQMETPSKVFRSTKSGVYRFNPRTYEIDFHFPIGPNPHGDVIDQWGYQFAGDGTGGTGSYVNIGKGQGNKQWYKKRVRPVAATHIINSSHFPEENQGNFLICNCIGVLGVLQHEVKYNGADITCEEIEPIVLSSDPNFRPSSVATGGDGALYISDWCNVLIGHMQHNMRDPNRDDQHGRIYRVTAKGRPLSAEVRLKGQPIDSVCETLFDPGMHVRLRARVELSGRKTSDVTKEVANWAAALDPKKVTDERDEAQALLECLWVFAEHRVPNGDLLARVFQAEEPRVRAAAIRTLGEWGDEVAQWKSLLMSAARDDAPLVRAEALKAAVSFTGTEAVEAVFEVATRPMDPEMDNLLKFARNNLPIDQIVADAVRSGKTLSPATDAFVLMNANVDALLKMKPRAEVYEAVLSRPSVSDSALATAIDGLVKLRGAEKSDLLLKLVEERNNEDDGDKIGNLALMLGKQPGDKLAPYKRRLEKLAADGATSDVRQLGYANMIVADGKIDAALVAASKSKDGLRDLLEAIPTVGDEQVRGGMYESVRSLMFELPPSLDQEAGGGAITASGINVDYFSSKAADCSIETFAKMKPAASGIVDHIGLDVPQRKKSEQFSLRFSGNVLVPRNGNYTFGISSDDGSRVYLDGKLLINHDGNHGMGFKSAKVRLKAGSHPIVINYFNNTGGNGLEVTWQGKGVKKQKLGGDYLAISGGESLHDLAVRATKSIPGHESEKLEDWTSLVQLGRSRPAAINALRGVPAAKWDEKQVAPLVDNLVGYLTELPAKMRTGAAAADATELAMALSTRLPAQQAEALKDRLQNLSVRVIALGTVPHRMIYDKTKIAVAAGKEMEIRFSNTDDMPHNVAIVNPGTMEKVGEMAEASARDADAIARHYIPKSDDVLASGKLVQPGESDVISFTAPKEPGIYPIVCTYPGHWRRMFGALYVVKDLEAYQNNPESYLAENPLETKDELLAYLDRNTEWKYDDVLASVKSVPNGRSQDSFEVGKSLFKVANCSGCHRLNNEGQNLGPDLAKLKETPKKFTMEHIVRSILEPSQEIEDKYRSYSFFMEDGKVHSGMVVSTEGGKVTIQNDPLGKCEPIVVNKSDIEEQTQSKLSIMPLGLLNKLSEEEIIDLVAYIYAGGDEKHSVYKK